jgi:hypothetical protein
VIELRTVRGPLDDEHLGWLSELYGPVDAKYGSLDFLRHQFNGNPFGWSACVFALDDGKPVGHSGVVPFRGTLDGRPIVLGKIEAVVVAASHRGRREDGSSLAVDVLRTLYAFALDGGVDVLFGLAPPHVARVHARAGCGSTPVDAPAWVLVASARSFGRGRRRVERLAAHGLALAQGIVVSAAAGAARLATGSFGAATIRDPTAADAELGVATPPPGHWTMSGADAWDWYAGSGLLKMLEVPGRAGSRALVRLDDSQPSTVQIVAWQAWRSGLLPAVIMLGAVARLARRRASPTVRFQPWPGAGGDGELRRACRVLGLVRRPKVDLLVLARDPAFPVDDVRLTPFFYVTF